MDLASFVTVHRLVSQGAISAVETEATDLTAAHCKEIAQVALHVIPIHWEQHNMSERERDSQLERLLMQLWIDTTVSAYHNMWAASLAGGRGK